jgi:hypothetical protein
MGPNPPPDPTEPTTRERVHAAIAGTPYRYDPVALIEAIVTRRNGDDQALGDLAELQRLFGDSEVTRMVAQCAYALGHQRGASGMAAELKPAALAWGVAMEVLLARWRDPADPDHTDPAAIATARHMREWLRGEQTHPGEADEPEAGERYIVGGDGVPYGPFPPERPAP